MNDKIELIRELGRDRGATLYAILFRNAGVGFHWYEGPRQVGEEFNTGLVVYRYYPTIDDAYVAELERLRVLPSIS